ncbi:Polygalacturonase 1 beta-like protein 3 [Dionaea muscipula]
MQRLPPPSRSPFFAILVLLVSSHVVLLSGGTSGENPFTPKAYLIRYWNNKIYKVPRSDFLLSKASPLSAAEAATFAQLAAQNALSAHLDSFCRSAHLLCFPDLGSSLEKHDQDVNFANYQEQNFTNYGKKRDGGVDTFKGYSTDLNVVIDTFRSYSRDAVGHDDEFTQYATESNIMDQTFNTYGTGTTGGNGDFKQYTNQGNIPGLAFTSYSDGSNGRGQSFSVYSEESNAGNQNFANYGKNGNGAVNSFISYGNNTNVIGSGFSSYSRSGNGGGDNFNSYGVNGNVPENTFKNYGDGGNAAFETFKAYRDQANVGDNSFQSYAKQSNAAAVNFTSYGQSFNQGTDKFTEYGKGADNVEEIGFTTYGDNTTFKDYTKQKTTFAKYNITPFEDTSAASGEVPAAGVATSGKAVNRWVEPGKFFREKMLKSGVVMPMPDIKDKMPQRAFLPRSILSRIPFSSSKVAEIKAIFHAFDNSTMETMIDSALGECERAPSRGETKRCVGSAEDMIDFAISVLGRSTELRTTESVNGAKKDVMIGNVRGINGGKVTQSVSCHQSLYPYLLYYCHSVPKVRVYEADILDPTNKAKINHGVAICHLDTSDWSSTHGAFLALGSGPGKIEVCHWIFENDVTWTIAD